MSLADEDYNDNNYNRLDQNYNENKSSNNDDANEYYENKHDESAGLDENDDDDGFTIRPSEIGNALNNTDTGIDNNQNIIKSSISRYENVNNEYDEDDDEVNNVKMVVTIVAGFPSGSLINLKDDHSSDNSAPSISLKNDRESEEEEYERGDGKRLIEGPKPQNYYKFEYQLMPDDTETTVTEVVTYKIAAKLFPDKEEPKVIKTWETDSQIWVAWNHTHELKLTKSRLLKMFEHELVLKIWDSKEYCSARTKFDRPKAFKLPQPKPGESTDELSEVKNLVLKQCNNYLRFIPKELHLKLDRLLPSQQKQSAPQEVIANPNVTVTNTLVAVSNKLVAAQKVSTKLSELAADTDLLKPKRTKEGRRSTSPRKSSLQIQSKTDIFKKPKKKSLTDMKSKKELANEAEQIKKNGTSSMKIRMKILFTDYKFVTVRLDKPTQTLEDCFVTISLESNLMSDRQIDLLNPMMIKVDKIVDLPEKPLSYNELKEKCEPVYCSYKFFKQPSYRTEARLHDKLVFYNDINVYLLGMIDQDELREYFYGPSFEIEVHDRDRKPNQHIQTPCLFGSDATDDQIASVNAVAAQKTVNNPFEMRNKFWDPFGVAKLNLYEFLEGKRLVQFYLPIAPCSAPDVIGRVSAKSSTLKTSTPLSLNTQNTTFSINSRPTTHDPSAMQAGNYLEANSHIYITVSFARALTSTEKLVTLSRNTTLRPFTSQTCVFGRLICVVEYRKTKLINLIFQIIRKINSSSLNLVEYSSSVQDAALSTYKLNEEEQKSKTLDIITGFHVLDGQIHILVLEGLKDYGLRYLYENIPRRKNDGIKILYNSAMNFSNRLYAGLDVDLLRIKLFEPLDVIVKKPLLYIRDMAPKASVEGLLKLHQLTSTERLRDATRCDTFPSAEMVVSMSREFGAPLSTDDLEEMKGDTSQRSDLKSKSTQNIFASNSNVMIPHTSKVWTPIDNYNSSFMQMKQEVVEKNFIKQNREVIHDKSEQNRLKKQNDPQTYIIIEKPLFNYSQQRLNTANIAVQQLRNSIRNSSQTLYTYNPEFHTSMTFAPVDLDEHKKEEERLNKEKWISTNNWVNRGIKSAIESNKHPKNLDESTMESLKEPWQENSMYANVLTSPLDRRSLKWEQRKNDFDIWKKPEDVLYKNIPVTIFPSGDSKEEEEKKILKKDYEIWREKIIVEDEHVKIHRLLPKTEFIEAGRNASNQIDKYKSLLKDRPKKKGLVTKNIDFYSIPTISVMYDLKDNNNNNKENTKYGFNPGDKMNLRITDDHNIIPIADKEHKKFIKLKGQDFRVYQSAKPTVYKRTAEPLKVEEKARFNEFFHSPYCEISKYILPEESDLQYLNKLQENKEQKKQIITT